jgi:hypothetical protein
MWPILCEVVELLAVIINSVVPVLQVKELFQLAAHEARWDMVTAEGGV